MYQFFEVFLKKMAARFRGISRATRNEVTPRELEGDAWIVANEIGKRRGREIDFSDPNDQGIIMGAVSIRNVTRPEKHFRYASRIDQSDEHEDGELNPWANRLRASEASDPLVALLLRESELKANTLVTLSYSQAVAYLMTFVHFKNNRKETCAHLAIAEATLAKRVTFAAETVRVQPSLFDRIERVAETFMPLPGVQYTLNSGQHLTGTQFGFNF